MARRKLKEKTRNKYRIKKNDAVIVIAGRSKGTQGKVLRVCPNERVYVEGANQVIKHVRPNPNVNEPGGRKTQEASIHISNIAIFNPKINKADRVGYKILADGKKVRIFRSTQEEIDI